MTREAEDLADKTIELIVGAERMRAARLEKLRSLTEEIETLRCDIRHKWDRYVTLVDETDRHDMESIWFFFESECPRRMQIRTDLEYLGRLTDERNKVQEKLDGQLKTQRQDR